MDSIIAGVMVESAVYAIDKPYSYRVPPDMEQTLKKGCRVLVPFGSSNKKVQGLVTELSHVEPLPPRLKAVAVLLDKEPIINEEMFRIVDFLTTNTFCTCYEAVRAILPVGANVDVTQFYQLTADASVLSQQGQEYTEEECQLLDFLGSPKTVQELRTFLGIRGNPDQNAAVKALLMAGLVEKSDRLRRKVAKRMVRMVRLAEEVDRTPVLSKKQESVVEQLTKAGCGQVKEICYQCGVTEGVLRTLAKKGIVVYFDREADLEEESAFTPKMDLADLELSESQCSVCESLLDLTHSGKAQAALLYGVTGSGKTQVYIKLIEQVIADGRTAMLLVPEIALTPQMVSKFEALFGGIVAVIHSSLSPAERMNEWNRIRAGRVKIVIGTRSAVFAPLPNIGVIILDEEGENSYKSENSPRYHARDVAKLRCVEHHAVLVLGSATPSVDSYYQAQRGSYSLFVLEERFAQANLPAVYLIDMREEQQKRNLSPLSGVLQEQLLLNLRAGEQSIVLINRRGYQTYATCMQCGEVVKCPHCDFALTYHRANGRLMCHYCGYTELFASKCPTCGAEYIKLTGAGTQKVEDELQQLLPDARILRMDTDTTYSKYSYEKNFDAFRRGKYDILLGTQMIAKGLDFPNVTLVGVISADSGLGSGDYRAGERVFSLITQVVGRSGRSEKAGRAYIQTNDPNHPVIQFAANQDYRAFYADEIVSRRVLTYPPFCDIVTLGFSGENEEAVVQAACRAMELLRKEASGVQGIAMKALGVSPAAVSKVSNKYRYRVIVKCRLNSRMKELISGLLRQCGRDRLFSGVSMYADVNGDIG